MVGLNPVLNLLEKAEELAQKALLRWMTPSEVPTVYWVVSKMQKGNFKEAVALRKKAVTFEPNSANYHGIAGRNLTFSWETGQRTLLKS